jgi:hypothetical protein
VEHNNKTWQTAAPASSGAGSSPLSFSRDTTSIRRDHPTVNPLGFIAAGEISR